MGGIGLQPSLLPITHYFKYRRITSRIYFIIGILGMKKLDISSVSDMWQLSLEVVEIETYLF